LWTAATGLNLHLALAAEVSQASKSNRHARPARPRDWVSSGLYSHGKFGPIHRRMMDEGMMELTDAEINWALKAVL
jgi:hypothetical protein